MPKKKSNRASLYEEIHMIGRRMSTVTVLFHQAIAESAGLSGPDHKYLDVLMQEGAMTAGQLAERTRLTTGAVTGLIDRLEKEGLVRRENDPHDRRKVLVVLQVEVAMKRIAPVFTKLQDDLDQYYGKYSEEQLTIIRDYLQDSTTYFTEKLKQLKETKRNK